MPYSPPPPMSPTPPSISPIPNSIHIIVDRGGPNSCLKNSRPDQTMLKMRVKYSVLHWYPPLPPPISRVSQDWFLSPSFLISPPFLNKNPLPRHYSQVLQCFQVGCQRERVIILVKSVAILNYSSFCMYSCTTYRRNITQKKSLTYIYDFTRKNTIKIYLWFYTKE